MNYSTLTLAAAAAALALGSTAHGATIIGGSTGNGDFNAGGGGTAGGAQFYDATPNWFNASGAENIQATQSSQMGGSGDPNNGTTTRGMMPFRDRVQINDTAYTITSAGEVFSLSYDFGAGGAAGNWEGLEDMRTFLFTSTTTVDGATVEGDITALAMVNGPPIPSRTSTPPPRVTSARPFTSAWSLSTGAPGTTSSPGSISSSST